MNQKCVKTFSEEITCLLVIFQVDASKMVDV